MAEGQDQDGGQEKTHDPTPQKLQEAREKGDVPRSMDLSAAGAYLGLLVAIAIFGSSVLNTTGAALRSLFDRADLLSTTMMGPGGAQLSVGIQMEVLAGLAPILALPFGVALVVLIAQRAFAVSAEKLNFKLSRISPLSQAKEKFGPSGLVQFGKNVVKMTAVAIVLILYLRSDIDRIIGAARADPVMLVTILQDSLITLLAITTAIALVIGGLDFAWQLFDHKRKLRMSFQDLKDDTKKSEGDPYMKGERQERARKIATNKMLQDVPNADVVITNPTHFAIALKWERTPGAAPVCVAKGVDEVALRIREVAQDADVPIHEDAPTARALFAGVEIGQQIPEDQYRAVAVAIQFADDMRRKARER